MPPTTTVSFRSSSTTPGSPSVHDDRPPRDAPPRRVRVGIIGLGRIGRAFLDLLVASRPDLAARFGIEFEVAHILVREGGRVRDVPAGDAPITADPRAFLATSCDVVVEATGVVEPILPLVRELLARGTSLVTANKELLARHGAELHELAAQSGAALRSEASVAAGVPLFSVLDAALQTTPIDSVTAILNGTSNFVLDALARGEACVAAAVALAQRLGLAEPDPAADLDGHDAARKLAVLATRVFGGPFSIDEIDVVGVRGVDSGDVRRAAEFGYAIKPIACAFPVGRAARGWVAPALVPVSHPLAALGGALNGILLRGEPAGEILLAGPGAGPLPTAAALLDDVLSAVREPRQPRPLARRVEISRAVDLPDVTATSWFATVVVEPRRVEPADVIEFLGAAGLRFSELRTLEEGAQVAICGVARAVPAERTRTIERGLAGVLGVSRVSFLRVLAERRAS